MSLKHERPFSTELYNNIRFGRASVPDHLTDFIIASLGGVFSGLFDHAMSLASELAFFSCLL